VTLVTSGSTGAHGQEPGEAKQVKARPRAAGFLQNLFASDFERVFVAATFVALGAILWLLDEKLAFLNFYFIPVLFAGYFLNSRGAVLGSVLAILVVSFIVIVAPRTFYQKFSPMSLYLDVVVWGSFLILTAAIVGTLTDELRDKFRKASDTLGKLIDQKEKLEDEHIWIQGRNLILGAEKSRLEAALHSTMDPVVARLLVSQQLKNERRQISALAAEAADMSSPSVERLPEVFVRDIIRLFAAAEPAILHYRGHLDRYTGDGFLAEFGVPFALRRHALLAALAAWQAQRRVAAQGVSWKLRIGVASGDCVLGLLGSSGRRNYTAIGPAVRAALRLRELCPPGCVLVDEAAARAVGRWFHLRPILSRAAAPASPSDAAAGRVAVETEASSPAQELAGRKDPLEDPRLPSGVRRMWRDLSKEAAFAGEELSLIEALEGSLGHSQATASLCALLGEAVGFNDAQLKDLFTAALLHDIGKSGFPEDALAGQARPDSLPQDKRELLKSHPASAEKVLRELGVPVTLEMLRIVRQHHERFDGSGYPQGLRGERIFLGARILHLADAYDRMTAGWGEGEPMSSRDALSEMGGAEGAGRFDPKLFAVFRNLFSA